MGVISIAANYCNTIRIRLICVISDFSYSTELREGAPHTNSACVCGSEKMLLESQKLTHSFQNIILTLLTVAASLQTIVLGMPKGVCN